MRRLGLALGMAAALAACGGSPPPSFARITGWGPQGDAASVDAVAVLELSAPIAPEGVADGARIGLALAGDARAVAQAAEREAGLGPGAPVVPCAISLDDDGRRVELVPLRPLRPGAPHALVVGPLKDRQGRPVLDPEGRRRTFLATFSTAPLPPGPPPRPVLTEVRALALAPEAGGEYVEVQNRGEGPLDLTGWRLEKRTASGAWSGCLLALAEGGPVAPPGLALVTGGAWDGRYAVPVGTARFACGGATLAGGLADERPPEVRLVDPAGAVRTTFGASGAPACPAALELVDPDGPDDPTNLDCALEEGTPGACNSVAPAWACS